MTGKALEGTRLGVGQTAICAVFLADLSETNVQFVYGENSAKCVAQRRQ